jgi:hypothetical protein
MHLGRASLRNCKLGGSTGIEPVVVLRLTGPFRPNAGGQSDARETLLAARAGLPEQGVGAEHVVMSGAPPTSASPCVDPEPPAAVHQMRSSQTP